MLAETPSFIQSVVALVGAIAVFLGAVQGLKLLSATKEQNKSTKEIESFKVKSMQEIEGVKVGQASIVQSNVELRLDNAQLRSDVADERKERERVEGKLDVLAGEFRAHRRYCTAQISSLKGQVIAMGGTPTLVPEESGK